MAGSLRVVDPATEDAVRAMPAAEVRCRSGWHRWALDSILPGEDWPDVVRAWPVDERRYRIEDPCLACHLAWRVTKTLPGGELDPWGRWNVVYDPDWVTVPQGHDRRKRTIRAEAYRRGAKRAASGLSAALARTAERDEQPRVAPVRFASA